MEHFNPAFKPVDGVARVLLAGTGAMLVLRAKLLTMRQPDGSDVAVGPAYAIDVLLNAVNRDIDRRRATERHGIVMQAAKALAIHDFAVAVPYLKSTLLAFQTMDKDESRRLSDMFDRFLKDDYKAMSHEIKFATAGFDILTVFGDRAFKTMFDGLALYLAALPRPAGVSG